MSVENSNKELVRRFIEHGYGEAMRGNLEAVHEYFADHYQDHTPMHHELTGVHGVKGIIEDSGQATPDMQMQVMQIAADGDLVFVHWRAAGTHDERPHQVTRHVRHLELPGEEWTVSGINLYRIEDGKLVEGWYYTNLLEFLQERAQRGTAAGTP